MRAYRGTGDLVEEGTLLATISDPFGEMDAEVTAEETGIVVGRTNMPVVNEGDALFHIAATHRATHAEAALEAMEAEIDAPPLFDEDEII